VVATVENGQRGDGGPERTFEKMNVIDDVMPHLVERIPVGLQLTLVRMDIERDVGLVVAHLPSLL
jgi:hypothetical protein